MDSKTIINEINHEEFEDLALEFVNFKKNTKYIANRSYRDGGVDFYSEDNLVLGQVKKYRTYNSLKQILKDEARKIKTKVEDYKSETYIFVVSIELEQNQRAEIKECFSDVIDNVEIYDLKDFSAQDSKKEWKIILAKYSKIPMKQRMDTGFPAYTICDIEREITENSKSNLLKKIDLNFFDLNDKEFENKFFQKINEEKFIRVFGNSKKETLNYILFLLKNRVDLEVLIFRDEESWNKNKFTNENVAIKYFEENEETSLRTDAINIYIDEFELEGFDQLKLMRGTIQNTIRKLKVYYSEDHSKCQKLIQSTNNNFDGYYDELFENISSKKTVSMYSCDKDELICILLSPLNLDYGYYDEIIYEEFKFSQNDKKATNENNILYFMNKNRFVKKINGKIKELEFKDSINVFLKQYLLFLETSKNEFKKKEDIRIVTHDKTQYSSKIAKGFSESFLLLCEIGFFNSEINDFFDTLLKEISTKDDVEFLMHYIDPFLEGKPVVFLEKILHHPSIKEHLILILSEKTGVRSVFKRSDSFLHILTKTLYHESVEKKLIFDFVFELGADAVINEEIKNSIIEHIFLVQFYDFPIDQKEVFEFFKKIISSQNHIEMQKKMFECFLKRNSVRIDMDINENLGYRKQIVNFKYFIETIEFALEQDIFVAVDELTKEHLLSHETFLKIIEEKAENFSSIELSIIENNLIDNIYYDLKLSESNKEIIDKKINFIKLLRVQSSYIKGLRYLIDTNANLRVNDDFSIFDEYNPHEYFANNISNAETATAINSIEFENISDYQFFSYYVEEELKQDKKLHDVLSKYSNKLNDQILNQIICGLDRNLIEYTSLIKIAKKANANTDLSKVFTNVRPTEAIIEVEKSDAIKILSGITLFSNDANYVAIIQFCIVNKLSAGILNVIWYFGHKIEPREYLNYYILATKFYIDSAEPSKTTIVHRFEDAHYYLEKNISHFKKEDLKSPFLGISEILFLPESPLFMNDFFVENPEELMKFMKMIYLDDTNKNVINYKASNFSALMSRIKTLNFNGHQINEIESFVAKLEEINDNFKKATAIVLAYYIANLIPEDIEKFKKLIALESIFSEEVAKNFLYIYINKNSIRTVGSSEIIEVSQMFDEIAKSFMSNSYQEKSFKELSNYYRDLHEKDQLSLRTRI